MPTKQETSHDWGGFLQELSLPNSTFGRAEPLKYLPKSSETASLDSASMVIAQLPGGELKDQVHEVVNLVRGALLRWQAADHPIVIAVHMTVAEDGTVLIEWASPEFRFGFNLEEEQEDSSWFIVSSPEFGGLVQSKRLVRSEIPGIVEQMARFAAENS